MTTTENDIASKASQSAKKQLMMWGLAGLLAGVAFGTVIGIAIYNQNNDSSLGSFSDVEDASKALGMPIFNSMTGATSNFLEEENLKGQVEALKEAFSGKEIKFAGKQDAQSKIQLDKSSNIKIASSNLFGNGNPKNTETPSAPKTTLSQPAKYKDGYGPDDINTATFEQLDKIPRLSETIIKQILSFIQTKSPILSFDQFLEINGVGEKTVDKLRQFFHIK